jgi:hypothetical protein
VTLPFSRSDFLAVFAAYNEAIWPLQLFCFGTGLLAIALLFYRPPWADRAISAVLAVFWLTLAIAYHWTFFAPVNPAAYLFGGSAAVLLGVPEDWALFGALVAWTGLALGESGTWRL